MFDLTAFQRDALYIVAGTRSPHGLAVKAEFDEYYDSVINHGRLYPNLDALVERGLLQKGKKDERTNVYSLSTRGHRALKQRREWENEYVRQADEAAPW
jgi:DNA-binding PadR family transcriptional regulator